MELSDTQKQQVTQWVNEGRTLADIQKALREEMDVQMTYMEVRFLIDDLDLDLAVPEPEPAAETPDAAPAEEPTEAIPAEAELVGGGKVSVELDKIKRPGAALSGSVTFSDGVKSKWFVDSYGRLGLDSDQEGYQPSPDDIEAFQNELQKALQGPGL